MTGGDRVSEDGFRRVASVAELPEGELRTVDLPGGRIALARIGGEVLAFDDACTHAGCSLAEGSLDGAEECVVCPCHGAAFDLRTGEPVDGPATDPLRVHEARVVDDWVEVRVDPAP